jgi:hypothetical protein
MLRSAGELAPQTGRTTLAIHTTHRWRGAYLSWHLGQSGRGDAVRCRVEDYTSYIHHRLAVCCSCDPHDHRWNNPTQGYGSSLAGGGRRGSLDNAAAPSQAYADYGYLIGLNCNNLSARMAEMRQRVCLRCSSIVTACWLSCRACFDGTWSAKRCTRDQGPALPGRTGYPRLSAARCRAKCIRCIIINALVEAWGIVDRKAATGGSHDEAICSLQRTAAAAPNSGSTGYVKKQLDKVCLATCGVMADAGLRVPGALPPVLPRITSVIHD